MPAFDAGYDAIMAATTLEDVLAAYNTAAQAIIDGAEDVAATAVKNAVKARITSTWNKGSKGWSDFVADIEWRITQTSGYGAAISNPTVTNATPDHFDDGDVITVTYTFDYAGVTYSDSTVVTVIA